MKILSINFLLTLLIVSCAGGLEYSEEHITETSGRYLYHQDDIMDVYYEDNELRLKWRGADKIKPVALDENEFFVADMYTKLRFVKHPQTNERYIGIITKGKEDSISYDYLKVADDYKTPSMHLSDKEFDKALEGFLAIKEKDSMSSLVDERSFNSMGYRYLRDKNYDDAIAIFKMNVALFPDSDNVYDSLADAYVRSGDSLQAFVNYSKALELNSGNKRAKEYTKIFKEKGDTN